MCVGEVDRSGGRGSGKTKERKKKGKGRCPDEKLDYVVFI